VGAFFFFSAVADPELIAQAQIKPPCLATSRITLNQANSFAFQTSNLKKIRDYRFLLPSVRMEF